MIQYFPFFQLTMASGSISDFSPVKFVQKGKKRSYSIDLKKCILCQEVENNDDELITCSGTELAKICNVIESKDSDVHDRLMEEFGTLKPPPHNAVLRYHRLCILPYQSEESLETNKGFSEQFARVTRSTNEPVDWAKCIICQQIYKGGTKKTMPIESDSRVEALKMAANLRRDEKLQIRMSNEELVKKARYHKNCMSSCVSGTNLKCVTNLIPHSIKTPYETAFDALINEVHHDLIKERKVFNLSNLLDKYKEHLSEVTIDGSSYKSSRLQERLLQHYGDQIYIQTQHGQGQSSLVMSSKITVAEAIAAATDLKKELSLTRLEVSFNFDETDFGNDDENDRHILYKAAQILRAKMEYKLPENYPPPSELSAESSESLLPTSLVKFIMWLIDPASFAVAEDDGQYRATKETQRKCLSIVECIMFCTGKVWMPQHLGLAVRLHKEYGSKLLIQILNAYGFSISYDELRKWLTSVSEQVIQDIHDGVYVPEEIERGGGIIHEGDDNIDINTETIDGKNTHHSMGRVIFQQQRLGNVHDLQRIKRVSDKSLQVTPDIEKLTQCNAKINIKNRSQPPRSHSPVDKITSCGEDCNPTQNMTWVLLRMVSRQVLPLNPSFICNNSQIIPMWNGFNSTLREVEPVFTRAAYAPVIDAKPADPSTVYVTMENCKKMSQALGQSTSVQTMDQQLYAVAKQVQWSRPDEFDNSVLRLGGFHTAMCFISCIGKLWRDGGLHDLLVDSGVYASNTADAMLQGKQFHRAFRGLTIVFEALQHTFVKAFLKWSKESFDGVWDQLAKMYETYGSQSNMSKTAGMKDLELLIQEELYPFMAKFRKDGEARSATFKYWCMCMDAIEILLQSKRAVAEGNWTLHLYSTRSMLPYFFICDKVNYARYTPSYLLDMMNLPPDVEEAFIEGQFNVKEVPGSFNGLWTDMGTEKTVIRESKGDGGIAGLTRKKSAMIRWSLTRHIVAEYSKVVDERVGLPEEDALPHKQTQNASMVRDEQDVKRLIEHLDTDMMNPFDIDTFDVDSFENGATLVNISTGLHASQVVTTSLLGFHEKGMLKMKQFVERSFDIGEKGNFYDAIKRTSLPTFTDMIKKTNIRGCKEAVSISPEIVFRRALAIADSRDNVNYSLILSHPITSVPTSIFHEDGKMRKTTKSELLHEFELDVTSPNTIPAAIGPSVYIRDAGGAVQTMNGCNYDNFNGLGEAYLKTLALHLQEAQVVVDVFDRYDDPDSVKAMERELRAGNLAYGKVYTVNASSRVPPWRKFLAVNQNKKSLNLFLSNYVVENAFRYLSHYPGARIVMAGGFNNGEIVKSVSVGRCQEEPHLFSNHEEADTKVVLHCVDADELFALSGHNGEIIVESSDTDVLVLLIHHFPKMENTDKLWLRVGDSNTQRYIPVHDICNSLNPVMIQILPSLHALSGSDTTSSFYYIGKRRVMRLMENKGEDQFKDLRSLGENDVEGAINAASKFVVLLYDSKAKTGETLNKLRVRLAKTKDTALAKLPPCEDTFAQKVLRDMFQTKRWMRAHEAKPDIGSPFDHAWKKEGDRMVPVYFLGKTAAEIISDLFCTCNKREGCRAGCPCLDSYMPCIDMCKCQADPETCHNPKTMDF